MKMLVMQQVDMKNLAHRGISEPWEILVGKKVFLIVNEDPKTKSIDICHLSPGNACAMRR